ncbi:helix-turn-helix domain-containing protein [Nitrosomonas sp. Nm51]|uniref:helix-turn-helix domain-containing protein n=1 Tax=Nitrosomonas sp. Nm51 TaxID=133720 RepID=UPI000B81BF06|nr:helix-turn-helix domain-containing protein [Nitrosomonas sp. Nm51]
MKTLTLEEAALFLKMHPEVVRGRAKAGIIPGVKAGKRWVFIEDDLVAYLRSEYACRWQALQVGHEEKQLCHSLNVEKRGGSVSPHQAANVLDALLQQKIKPKRRNSMTD